MNDFHNIIKEICKKNNIKINILSEGWIISLEKNNIKKFITGYKFDNNTHALGEILDDKYGTYEILKLYNIPVCDYNIVYSPLNKNDYAIKYNSLEYVTNLFNKYNHNIVFKINNGTCGNNVNKITTIEELKEKFLNLKPTSTYSISPYYEIINEYRVIVLNKNIELMYKKELPIVYGDGKKSIKELLLEFNYEYFSKINDEKLEKILEQDEKYVYSWKFNLSQGSRASFDINEEDKEEIKKIVNQVFDIGFCSIDIIKTIDNKYMVLEINSGIMMKNLMEEYGTEIAKKIYEKAMLSMFKE